MSLLHHQVPKSSNGTPAPGWTLLYCGFFLRKLRPALGLPTLSRHLQYPASTLTFLPYPSRFLSPSTSPPPFSARICTRVLGFQFPIATPIELCCGFSMPSNPRHSGYLSVGLRTSSSRWYQNLFSHHLCSTRRKLTSNFLGDSPLPALAIAASPLSTTAPAVPSTTISYKHEHSYLLMTRPSSLRESCSAVV